MLEEFVAKTRKHSSNEPTKKIIPNLKNGQNSHTTYFKISTKTGEKSLLALIFG